MFRGYDLQNKGPLSHLKSLLPDVSELRIFLTSEGNIAHIVYYTILRQGLKTFPLIKCVNISVVKYMSSQTK